MKLATYNVNGRLPVLLRWLEQSGPDVVCLQELKAPDERFPVAAIEKAGYGAIWHGQKAWNGVAILARGRQPEENRRGLPGDPDDTHNLRGIENRDWLNVLKRSAQICAVAGRPNRRRLATKRKRTSECQRR